MGLNPEQERVTKLVLSVGGNDIHLAGGAALIVHGLIDRTTNDVDAFLSAHADTFDVASETMNVLSAHGYTASDVSTSPTSPLRKLRVRRAGHAEVSLEIGRDTRLLPGVTTYVGQTLSPTELGANKIISLYGDPSRARDADDLAHILLSHELPSLLALADRKEGTPLDRDMLAEAMHQVASLDDSEFPETADVPAVKAFMDALAQHVQHGEPLPASPYRSSTHGPPSSMAGQLPSGNRCGAPKKRGGYCLRRISDNGCPYHG